MTWDAFDCFDADFTVRSLPDGTLFRVKRICLENGSEVFSGMFSCCDDTPAVIDDPQAGVMDLNEPSHALSILLRLLHEPPVEYIPEKVAYSEKFQTQIPVITPKSAIPLPLIPLLLRLADKYALTPPLVRTLHSHLAAHKSTFPMRVYGLATEFGLDYIAAKASNYLLHPPLHTYRAEEIRVIPTAEAYHKLVVLHAHRVARMREILMGEVIFPFGYGECSVHKTTTVALWDQQRKALVPKTESGTDVAAEMNMRMDSCKGCDTCRRACNAAVDMLAYKCRRVARRIDKIP